MRPQGRTAADAVLVPVRGLNLVDDAEQAEAAGHTGVTKILDFNDF